MIIISKNKLKKILKALEDDSCDQAKAYDKNDFYWRCGNANAVNYIKSKLNIK